MLHRTRRMYAQHVGACGWQPVYHLLCCLSTMKKLMQHCKERARTNGEGKGHGGGNMDFSSTSEQILDLTSQPWNCQRKCLDTVGCLSIREKEGFLHCQGEGLSPLYGILQRSDLKTLLLDNTVIPFQKC